MQFECEQFHDILWERIYFSHNNTVATFLLEYIICSVSAAFFYYSQWKFVTFNAYCMKSKQMLSQ